MSVASGSSTVSRGHNAIYGLVLTKDLMEGGSDEIMGTYGSRMPGDHIELVSPPPPPPPSPPPSSSSSSSNAGSNLQVKLRGTGESSEMVKLHISTFSGFGLMVLPVMMRVLTSC
ncbi:hypothetical protein STEG23_010627 [Scotinomys teguina]